MTIPITAKKRDYNLRTRSRKGDVSARLYYTDGQLVLDDGSYLVWHDGSEVAITYGIDTRAYHLTAKKRDYNLRTVKRGT